MTVESVDTQVIANLVVRNREGAVLFVRTDPDSEKWWLPGQDVVPFTHPDAAAAEVAASLDGLEVRSCRLSHVDSFRGRRGWHLVFHYDLRADGDPTGRHEACWFDEASYPRTMHGGWEKQVIGRVSAADRAQDRIGDR